jgi:tryptophan synthase alpha chain
MSRIGERFRALRARGEKALVPFVTAGDPDLPTTEALVPALCAAGADLVEIGVPFSDPIAEGPTIQRASERALRGGVSLRRILELVERLRPRVEVPLVLMGYANNVLAMGERAFAERAAAVGVDGLIAVDLPPEEGESLFGELRLRGVDPILLAAPTTRPARLALLTKETRGFLYFVSLTGVTGARQELSRTLEREVRAVRALSDVPVCVGFGVATPEHARDVARYADGVAVGSALIDRIEGAASPEEAVEAASRFVAALKAPLRGSG